MGPENSQTFSSQIFFYVAENLNCQSNVQLKTFSKINPQPKR